jgi:aspartate 1-decarboxylase
MAELVHPVVTGAELNYQGSITIDPDALRSADLLPGQMVYIDNINRKGPAWRTYIVPGKAGAGEIIMNGPPAYHFKSGDPVTIRGGALISFAEISRMASNHTRVHFGQNGNSPNRVVDVEHYDIPELHWRQMCISKLHRLVVTHTSPEGPEALIVDEDILDAAGFPAGIEAQFTSLKDGALRRTCVQAGPRGTGMAKIQGSGAQYIAAGVRLVTLAEAWLPYEDALKVGGPQVAFFNETVNDRNVIREIKTGWRPF